MLLPTEPSYLKISFRNMILRDLAGKQESSLSVFESVIKVMNFLPSQIHVNIHLAYAYRPSSPKFYIMKF